jgi:hypothetical protein
LRRKIPKLPAPPLTQQPTRLLPPAQPPATNTTSVLLGGVGPFDLDSRSGLRAAVAARAVGGEIVTFTSNVGGLAAAANMALQLRRHGILQHMVLADAASTCAAGLARWAWLGCGWSSGLPGFEAAYAHGVGGETAHLWSLWSAKWLLVARLTELRVNVLALDTDMLLQADPYPLLRAPPISAFHMVIVPEGSRVNLGFIYVRGRACARAGGVASVLWDVVRRLRLFTEDWPLLSRNGRSTSTYGLCTPARHAPHATRRTPRATRHAPRAHTPTRALGTPHLSHTSLAQGTRGSSPTPSSPLCAEPLSTPTPTCNRHTPKCGRHCAGRPSSTPSPT